MMNKYRFRIEDDPNPPNPRCNQLTISTIVCWHKRHTLGDIQPVIDPAEYFLDLLLDKGLVTQYEVDDSYHYNEMAYRELSALVNEHVFRLPVYLNNHSGIRISTTKFSCPWDSSQLGWVYLLKTDALVKFPERGDMLWDRVFSILKKEVSDYDHFINGEVSSYFFEQKSPNSLKWECVSSGFGFFGYDPMKNGMYANWSDLEKSVWDSGRAVRV